MTVRTTLKETGNTEALLQQMPIELRTKHLKRAIGKAARVMAKDARRRAPVDSDGDDGVQIKKSIRSRTVAAWDKPVVRGIVEVKGLAGAYSIPLEYGHDLVAWGHRTSGRVRQRPFFRPAADTTEDEQHRAIVTELKGSVRDLGA
jgi:hypothetical protein